MKTFQTPDARVLTDLLSWISEGICRTGPYNSSEPQLVFHAEMCYGVDKKPSTILTVFNSNNQVLGVMAPIHNENTGAVEGFVMNRKTELGYFVDRTSGLYEYMADYAVNFYLVDPDVIKRTYEDANKNFNGDLRAQVRETAEDPIPAKVTESLITVKEFLKAISSHQPLDNDQLGEVVGRYRLTDTDELAKLGFECFIAGDSVENWVQVLVLENGTSKFPRILGTFRHDQGFVSIESRFFKGEVRADDKSNLVNAINTYLVKPYANNRAK